MAINDKRGTGGESDPRPDLPEFPMAEAQELNEPDIDALVFDELDRELRREEARVARKKAQDAAGAATPAPAKSARQAPVSRRRQSPKRKP